MAFGREQPDDLTAEVLRRLPPRSLAVSRCVCRGWRDLVDAGRLLRVDLLPRSVGGIFIHYSTLYCPEFLARPTTGRPSISGELGFIPARFPMVVDHCNGLLLCTDRSDVYIANPATRQWARLPTLLGEKRTRKRQRQSEEAFVRQQIQIKWLVYDPTMSRHYEVFLIHSLPGHDLLPWCPLRLHVYSSETGRWEERLFVREGRGVKTIAAVDGFEASNSRVYWRGALYLLCKNGFVVLRVSISDAKYRMIPLPEDNVGFSRSEESDGTLYLGKSEKGVYCASAYDWHRLRIFHLNESSPCGQTVWEPKHSVDFRAFSRELHALKGPSDDHEQNGPWMLQDINHHKYAHRCYSNDRRREAVENRFEWDSDDDSVLSTEEMVEGHYPGYMSILGFHPYKEIVFLNAGLRRAVAYHWNTSKFQDLGNIFPKDYHLAAGHVAGIETSFIYTPCWMDGGFLEEERKSASAS